MTSVSTRPLHSKIAWITGASRGIGRATATMLADAGARVFMGARNMEQLRQVETAIASRGGSASALELDVADAESCARFAAAAREAGGLPDILINNAGMGVFRHVENFLPGEFERNFQVNVFGMFYMTRLAVPMMRLNGGGHIVNVSSLAGESSGKMGSGYFASKHAVHGFTKCLLDEVRDDDIKVTLVCPGSVDTRFHHDSHPGSHENPDQTWMAKPEDVASAILHALTTPAAALVSKIDVRPQKKGK